jgi:hypothetical protein
LRFLPKFERGHAACGMVIRVPIFLGNKLSPVDSVVARLLQKYC